MNKARLRTVAMIGLLVAAALVLGSCEWAGQITINFTDVTGNIVDARSEDLGGVEGVTVTLTPRDVPDGEEPDVQEETTDSSGTFLVAGVPSGTYLLEAKKDGWFIPSQVVKLGQSSEGINDIPAFQLRPDDLYGISFILMWNDQVQDVDIHLTVPTGWNDDGNPDFFTTPYDDYTRSISRYQVFYRDKFYNQDDTTVYPSHSYYQNEDTFPNGLAYMDRDDQDGFGPETATLVEVTYDYLLEPQPSYSMSVDEDDDVNGLYTAFGGLLPSDTTDIGFAWLGTAEVYLDAFSTGTNLSSGGSDTAEAIVYVMQTLPTSGADADDINDNPKKYQETAEDVLEARYLGAFRVPDATTLKSARIARVNMLESNDGDGGGGLWYQLVPDIEVIPEGPNTDSQYDDYGDEPGQDGEITFQSEGTPSLFGAYGGKSRR